MNANSGFLINGQAFDHNRVSELVKLGPLNEWTLVNQSEEDHPFHLLGVRVRARFRAVRHGVVERSPFGPTTDA